MTDVSSASSTNQALNIDDGISNYINLNASMNEDSLNFYKVHHGQFPLLSKCVKYYFAIAATSVPSEQLFSKAGKIIFARRNRLSPSNAEMLVL